MDEKQAITRKASETEAKELVKETTLGLRRLQVLSVVG